MEYYAGIDVSLRSCALCIVDGKGTVLLEREMLTCALSSLQLCTEPLSLCLKRVSCRLRVWLALQLLKPYRLDDI